jgi:hypothetical protein
MNNSETLYDWLFHYSPYTEVWTAFRREDKERYFNGELKESEYFKSSKVTTLVEFLTKHNK